jgi:AcrR family transcriptional regulator
LTKTVRDEILIAMKTKASPKKTRKTRSKPLSPAGKSRQKVANRDKILEAAKRVFSEYPYSAATIRMVGEEAEIDHPLITYYFPTKAELFEAVVEDTAETFVQASISWYQGLEHLSVSKGLSLYLDRLFAFTSKHPEALGIPAVNLAKPKGAETIPGYKQMQWYLTRNTETFRKFAPLRGPTREIRMFVKTFNTMIINYLGAANYHARTLGMNPGSPAYRKWVKDAMHFLFLPRLRQLIYGEDREASGVRRAAGSR